MTKALPEREFIQVFLDQLQTRWRILDLGAGQGDFAHKFVERSATVTAVDVLLPKLSNPAITPKRMRVEEYIAATSSETFDAVFARNILQFLDRSWVFETLFPWIANHLTPHGLLAIETFYRDPEPPFPHPLRSFYTLAELTPHFISWNELLATQSEHQGLDMAGQARKFFTTDMIVKKR